MLIKNIGTALVFLSLSSFARSSFLDGIEAYTTTNYGKAFTEFRQLANTGDAVSSFLAGVMYFDGKCVLGKYPEASLDYFKESSANKMDFFQKELYLSSSIKEVYGLCSSRSIDKNIRLNTESLQKIDDEEAFSLLLNAANQEDVDAQFLVALMYINGRGVPRNDAEGVNWLLKASNQGHTQSQYYLALFYKNGWGMEKEDNEQSLKWLMSAAEQGQANAQYLLGSLYENGEQVNKDIKLAEKWYREAAKNKNTAAEISLGINYFQKNDSKLAEDDAAELMNRMVNAEKNSNFNRPSFPTGNDLNSIIYEKLALYGNENAILYLAKYTSDKVKSANLYKKLAEQGNAEAQYQMWELSLFGVDGVIKADKVKAKEWLIKSAENGYESSQSSLAYQYYEENSKSGFSQDYEKALYWYSKLAKNGQLYAQNKIASMYAEGKGVLQDYTKAISLYSQSVEKGNLEANRKLASLYLDIGSYEKSFKIYEKLANKGDIFSQGMIASFYKFGGGTIKKDKVKAYAWLNIVASQGGESEIESRKVIIKEMTKPQILTAQKLSNKLLNTISQIKCSNDDKLCLDIVSDNNLKQIYKKSIHVTP